MGQDRTDRARCEGEECGCTCHEAPGPVEQNVRDDLDALTTAHPMGESLSAMSINLAQTLDAGAGLAVAAVNRELRANLVELASQGGGDDDLDAELSAAMGDTPQA